MKTPEFSLLKTEAWQQNTLPVIQVAFLLLPS
jgi:hypothetical protein